MHKTIALIIKKMCDESPYNHFRCEVIPNMNEKGEVLSAGFWRCNIYFDSRDDAHSTALVNSLRDIGTIYGEGLWVEDKGNIVKVG